MVSAGNNLMIKVNEFSFENNIQFKNDTFSKNVKLAETVPQNVAPLSFKGAQYLKGLALSKSPFVKQTTPSETITLASEEDKSKIEDLIKSRGFIYGVDYEINRVLPHVKTKEQAELAIAALEKKVDGSFLYSTYQVGQLVFKNNEPELAKTASEVISNSDVRISEYVVPTLNKLKTESPDKYQYLLGSSYLLEYLNKTVDYANDGTQSLIFTKKLDEFPILESLSSHISEDLNYDYCFHMLLDLYERDEEAYNYAINSPILMDKFFGDYDSKSCINVLNKNALVEIEKGFAANTSKNPQIISFVESSDDFKEPDVLSSYISQFKTDGEITVYRAERSTGSFEAVPINDDLLEKKIRAIVKLNYFKTKKDTIVPSSGKYSNFGAQHVPLYDYINSKKELSLSDAMLVAKYADKRYVDEILHLIENAELTDSRFKSTSFSERFVDSWMHDSDNKNVPKIKSKLTIEEGTEGVYVSSANHQFEFILNDNEKQITYNKAKYDKKTNTFVLEGNVGTI